MDKNAPYSDIFQEISRAIDSVSAELRDISLRIHERPELAFEEKFAHETLTAYIEKKGFTVQRQACNLSTAFIATWENRGKETSSKKPVVVGFISEYDALPIGHACGHNLIAISGLAASIGTKAAMEKFEIPGIVKLFGTPAEEGKGGKVKMINAGAFKDVDVAIMVHPGKMNNASATYLALQPCTVEYSGKSAHSACAPWEGVNALDALVLAYQSIAVLRQQIKPTDRVHGIITKGGDAVNIIPERTSGSFMARGLKLAHLSELIPKIANIFDSAALATGCKHKVEWEMMFADVRTNSVLANVYEAYLTRAGCHFVKDDTPQGSTDMGNVTHVVPGIHCVFDIGGSRDANIHTLKFRDEAKSEEAHNMTLRAAKGVSITGIEVFKREGLLEKVKKEFSEPP